MLSFNQMPERSGIRKLISNLLVSKEIKEYLAKAPLCGTCNEPIMPGPVGRVDGSLVHLTRKCCDLGVGFAGYIDNNGQFQSYKFEPVETTPFAKILREIEES